MSETEAFRLAATLYQELIVATTPPASAEIIAGAEQMVFRPAGELQLAGLNLLGGRDFQRPDAVVVSLACFTIDHLFWGWTAAVHAQPRVAATLSRAAVEAAIFAIAAREDFRAFEKAWNTRNGTGGAMLKSIQRAPASVKALMEEVWKSVVPLGHASIVPVMSSRGTFLDGREKRLGISFGGQYAGPLDATLLMNLANLYCLAAIVAVEAMNITLRPLLACAERWDLSYGAFKSTLGVRSPIPAHLEPYMDRILAMRKRSKPGAF